MSENDNSNNITEKSRANILILMDSFIEEISSIRKTLLCVSVSALIVAPLAIGLSIYLILHPSFFAIIEIENEFGLLLILFVAVVLIICSIWLTSGIKQYLSIGIWGKGYNEYKKGKEKMDRKIVLEYGLGSALTPD